MPRAAGSLVYSLRAECPCASHWQAALGNLGEVDALCRVLLAVGIASAAVPGRRLPSRAFAPECQASFSATQSQWCIWSVLGLAEPSDTCRQCHHASHEVSLHCCRLGQPQATRVSACSRGNHPIARPMQGSAWHWHDSRVGRCLQHRHCAQVLMARAGTEASAGDSHGLPGLDRDVERLLVRVGNEVQEVDVCAQDSQLLRESLPALIRSI